MDILKKLLVDYLADDKTMISYRPSFNQFTGGVLATLLLQQILYWYKNNNYKPFYKFRTPCKHKNYKDGDSWTEETGFTEYEFDSALKKIGIKMTKETKEKKHEFLVEYWRTPAHLTYFQVNIENLLKKIQGLKPTGKNKNSKSENIKAPNREKSNYLQSDKTGLDITETTRDYTKNSSSSFNFETTNKKTEQEIRQKLKGFSLGENDIQNVIQEHSQELDRVLLQVRQTEFLFDKNLIKNRALIFKKNLVSGYVDNRYKQHLTKNKPKKTPVELMQEELKIKLQTVIDKYNDLRGESITSDKDLIRIYKSCKYNNSDLISILEYYFTKDTKDRDSYPTLKAFLSDSPLLDSVYENVKLNNLEMWSQVQTLFSTNNLQ